MPITTLHVALEFGDATLGGLGVVVTQMADAQSRFVNNAEKAFVAKIITPYYKKIYKYKNLQLVSRIKVFYDNCTNEANILLAVLDQKEHYMVEPIGTFAELFNIDSIHSIYNNLKSSLFIERIKYFNSAVAAYLHKREGIIHPNPNILVLHDWQAALLPKLLAEKYNSTLKSIFIIHVSNIDNGAYHSEQLKGIGLNFQNHEWQMLKSIGFEYSDKIVAVSQSFLSESFLKSNNPNVELLRKMLIIAKLKNKVFGILNGFDFNYSSIVKKHLPNYEDIYALKRYLKYKLSGELQSWYSSWRINPELPVIFFIGRFTAEKGVDTFSHLIKIIRDKAIFFALGRGLTESVRLVINQHSKRTNNIFISDSDLDQNIYKADMRACADFTFVCSYREACGLVPLEGFANGSLCITSGVGGLRDSVRPLDYKDKNNTKGNGFIYNTHANENEKSSLSKTISEALSLWSELNPHQKNLIYSRVVEEAKDFDWLSPAGPLTKYLEVSQQTLKSD